jgi:hypothetical protein
MANNDIRRGLCAVQTLDGTAYNGRLTPYYVPSTYGTALFKGDPVVMNGSANTVIYKNNKPGTLPVVIRATAGATNRITGVVQGFDMPMSVTDTLSVTYKPANTEAIVWVSDSPSIIYEIQADSTAAIAVTAMGANANLIYTHSGDTTYGISGAELDTSSITTDATYQLQILRLVNREDNELGTNAKLLVRINLPTFANDLAGV